MEKRAKSEISSEKEVKRKTSRSKKVEIENELLENLKPVRVSKSKTKNLETPIKEKKSTKVK